MESFHAMNHYPGCTLNVHLYVSDVIEGVAKENREHIRAFVQHIEDWTLYYPFSLTVECFDNILSGYPYCGTKAALQAEFNKDQSILCAMWVIFIRVYRMSLLNDDMFKYKSYEQFDAEYGGIFSKLKQADQSNLFYTAQWMSLCQSMTPGKRNKGFYMHVIPKVIEGFHAKYATGSGQSSVTSMRVVLFEHESGVVKSRKRMPDGSINPLVYSSSLINGRKAAILFRSMYTNINGSI